MPIEEIRKLILETVAASGMRNSNCRYWISAGQDSLSLIPPAGTGKLFILVFTGEVVTDDAIKNGTQEATVDFPLKHDFLLKSKTTNYMMNYVTASLARKANGYLGITCDPDGAINESTIASVAFIQERDGQDYFVSPRLHSRLPGTTLMRVEEILKENLEETGLAGLIDDDVKMEDVYQCKEVYSVGGDKCLSITSIDGKPIGDGKPGKYLPAILKLMREDLTKDIWPVPPYEKYEA
mmetsp:Transcript_35089/g.39820  ORF Transcript_35089/g.39820 Transcript_35089/m.39820 type:complete len:238 (-) Transcript_35089:1146-1859(-)